MKHLFTLLLIFLVSCNPSKKSIDQDYIVDSPKLDSIPANIFPEETEVEYDEIVEYYDIVEFKEVPVSADIPPVYVEPEYNYVEPIIEEYNHIENIDFIEESPEMLLIEPIYDEMNYIVSDESSALVIPESAPNNNHSPRPNFGSMVYSVEDTMKVGETYTIDLRISKMISTSIAEDLVDDYIIEVIPTSETMEVLLFDPNPDEKDASFLIKPLTESEQWLSNDTAYTEWKWTVRPLKKGQHSLKLVINIIKTTPVGNMKKSITVFQEDIQINSSPGYSFKKWWKNNWQYLFSTLILPFLIWLYKRFSKDKEKID
jgi:hypothetical protein